MNATGSQSKQDTPPAIARTTIHRALADGVTVFYREAGPADAPVLLLLHGFPTSSFQFRELMPRVAVEPADIRQHRQEARPHQIAFLRKQAAETDAAGIFEIPAIERRRERHVRDLGRNLEMREQRAQIGIGRPVEHDKAGIDGDPPPAVKRSESTPRVINLWATAETPADGGQRTGAPGSSVLK